jgi:hypothetical protein
LEIPKYTRPEIELVYEGVNVDALGMGFQEIADSAREEVLAAFPRLNFKKTMPRTFTEAIFHKPQTGWANTMGDAVQRFLPGYVRPNSATSLRARPSAIERGSVRNAANQAQNRP